MMYDKVHAFREKMGLPIGTQPQLLSPEQTSYFARFIMEELSEYLRGVEEGSLVDASDALVDLVYVTLGMAHAMGLPFYRLFNIVHAANMEKEPANDFIRSLRGQQYDVVKPLGWIPPEPAIHQALIDAGAKL
mgnify:CR=1 FL=1